MSPADLDALLREFPKASAARLKRLQREGAAATMQPWFDQHWYERLKEVYTARHLQAPGWTQRALGAGEAWLLLYEGSAGVGTVATLRAELDGAQRGGAWAVEAQDESRLALGGLVAALAERGIRLPKLPFRYRLTADSPLHGATIAGGSLGVSVCAAVTAAALGVAIRRNVAASACVKADGTLFPVEYLSDKLKAVRRHQPTVDTVIVASEQPAVDVEGITLLPCADVIEALAHFGLDFDALPRTDLASCRRRVRQFDVDDEENTSSKGWGELAAEAWFAYRVLSQAGTGLRSECAEALGWWILFSAHAGHIGDIAALRDDVLRLQSNVNPTQHALVQVFLATWQIDTEPQGAVKTSLEALNAARALSASAVLGRALGTHGRALMHSGDPSAAVPWLEQSVAEHETSDPREVPRSRTYLATAQRLAGDPAAGLRSTASGLAQLDTMGRLDYAEKTRCYLELERGRCLLALDEPRGALASFDVAARACEFDHDHPRSAALRGLAEANRLLGNHDAAEDCYGRCLAVAGAKTLLPLLRRVAAMAMADKWASNELDPEEKTIWKDLFPEDAQRDAALARRARWIY